MGVGCLIACVWCVVSTTLLFRSIFDDTGEAKLLVLFGVKIFWLNPGGGTRLFCANGLFSCIIFLEDDIEADEACGGIDFPSTVEEAGGDTDL